MRGLPVRPAFRLRFAARRRPTFWLLRSRNENHAVRGGDEAAIQRPGLFFER